MGHIKQTVLAPADLTSETLNRWIEVIESFDRAGWPLVLVGNCDEKDPLDGLAIAAFCAARTSQIGLCAQIDPHLVEPFTLARSLATLDHMSGGRAAWRIRPESDTQRALELIDAVNALLKSWDSDALIEDRENGMLSRADKVHPVQHEGRFFAVEGPLNIPQPPQGHVPLIAMDHEKAFTAVADLVLNCDTLWSAALADLPSSPRVITSAGQLPFLSRIVAQ